MWCKHLASSVIEAVGYEPSGGQLSVLLRSGALYRYDGVPRACVDALLRAHSHGRYFQHSVRAVYPNRRLSGPEALAFHAALAGTTSWDARWPAVVPPPRPLLF